MTDTMIMDLPESRKDADPSVASFELRKLAREDSPLACFELGLWHEFGLNGTEPDAEEARKWYERAAFEFHLAAAYTALGRLNYTGQLGDPDRASAEECFRIAANAGDLGAQFAVGYMVLGRDARTKTLKEACEFFRRAARAGHAPSTGMLAYVEGRSQRWISWSLLIVQALVRRVSARVRRDGECLLVPIPTTDIREIKIPRIQQGRTREEWFLTIMRTTVAGVAGISGALLVATGRVWASLGLLLIAFLLGIYPWLTRRLKILTAATLVGLGFVCMLAAAVLVPAWWIFGESSGNLTLLEWMSEERSLVRAVLLPIVACLGISVFAAMPDTSSQPDVSIKERVRAAHGHNGQRTTDTGRIRYLRAEKEQSEDKL